MDYSAAQVEELDAIAADYPERHIWRGRDRNGSPSGWYATLRRHPDAAERRRGLVITVGADDSGSLREQLAQQRS